jgi:hypothetical protein
VLTERLSRRISSNTPAIRRHWAVIAPRAGEARLIDPTDQALCAIPILVDVVLLIGLDAVDGGGPESIAGLLLAGHQKLDDLTYVIPN